MEKELELVILKENYFLKKQNHQEGNYSNLKSYRESKEQALDTENVIVCTAEYNFIIKILSTVNRELLKLSRLDQQKQEIREAIQLPLIEDGLYKQIRIEPPKGVLLYVPPGTYNNVKAVANKAKFIRVNGLNLHRSIQEKVLLLQEISLDQLLRKHLQLYLQMKQIQLLQRNLIKVLVQIEKYREMVFDQNTNAKLLWLLIELIQQILHYQDLVDQIERQTAKKRDQYFLLQLVK